MKYKRKLIPVNPMNIPAMESWLSDLAAEGLYLYSLGSYFAKFTESEPRKLAYRIEPIPVEDHGFYINNIRNAFASAKDGEKPLTIEEKNRRMVELYAEFGWKQVCRMNQLFYIFRAKEEETPELHTDPVAQSAAYERIYQRQKKGFLFVLPFFIAMLAWCLYLTIWDDNLYYTIKSGSSLLFCVLGLLISAFVLAKEMKSFRLIRDRLKEGIAMEHTADWQKSAAFYKAKFFVYHVFLVYIIFSSYYWVNQSWDIALEEAKQPLPYVSLETIETATNFILGEYDGWDNEARFNASFFAPIQYEIRQEGTVPDRRWNDDSGVYSPSIMVEYFDLRFRFLAEPFYDAMVKWHIYDETGFTHVYDDSVDEGVLYDTDDSKKMLFRKGDKVMAFFYYGHEDLMVHLPDIVALTDVIYSKD
ncbi:DUF2812 domain-containing protein [Anaerotignum sp.]